MLTKGGGELIKSRLKKGQEQPYSGQMNKNPANKKVGLSLELLVLQNLTPSIPLLEGGMFGFS